MPGLKEPNSNNNNNVTSEITKPANIITTGNAKEELAKQAKDEHPNQEVEVPTSLPADDPYNPNAGLRDPGTEGEKPNASNSTNPPAVSNNSMSRGTGKPKITNTKSANSGENPYVVKGEALYEVREMNTIDGFAGNNKVEYKEGEIISESKFYDQLERLLELDVIQQIPGQAY